MSDEVLDPSEVEEILRLEFEVYGRGDGLLYAVGGEECRMT